ncbi:regulatory GntR family protein [Leucobacter luti]|uniref:Regulatory GntR family protein n=1 Tax=Leucobacter luti TaxID=340320 RepID=A0A4R6RX25_9MICO|nr:GntR family transcriptional regulator [Leucobacter luti]TDP90726.1 regulatory GntR family protein [Leucobacter luti]
MPVPKQRIEIPARRLLRDDVHDAIREAILTGQFAPGERLEDSALQAWLGVSRTPVRQAIDALVRKGLVETAAQSFTRVVNPDPRNSRHVSGTVGVLMSGVTRWAVVRLSVKKREHAAALAEQIAQELRSRDRESFARDAVEFFAIMQRGVGIRCCNSCATPWGRAMPTTWVSRWRALKSSGIVCRSNMTCWPRLCGRETAPERGER